MKPRFGGARRAGPGEWVRGRRREGEMREIERFFQSRMRYLESFREKRERERDEPSRFLSPRFSLVWADKSSRFPSQERVARSEIARGVSRKSGIENFEGLSKGRSRADPCSVACDLDESTADLRRVVQI